MKCPKCGGKLVPIIYGMPSVELMEKVEKKEVYLGGCCIIGDKEMPSYFCNKCNKEFGKSEIKTDTK